jgi:hypothetical protein
MEPSVGCRRRISHVDLTGAEGSRRRTYDVGLMGSNRSRMMAWRRINGWVQAGSDR